MSWDPSLDTGHPSIDREHRELLAMLVDFKAIIDEAPGPRVVTALDTVRRKVADHFAYEERLMDAIGLQGTRDHRDAHTSYLADLQRSLDQIQKSGINNTLRQWAHGRLNTWFRFHIKAYDIALARAVVEYERTNGPVVRVT